MASLSPVVPCESLAAYTRTAAALAGRPVAAQGFDPAEFRRLAAERCVTHTVEDSPTPPKPKMWTLKVYEWQTTGSRTFDYEIDTTQWTVHRALRIIAAKRKLGLHTIALWRQGQQLSAASGLPEVNEH
eukprot:3290250-Amphidinium_carterae.2